MTDTAKSCPVCYKHFTDGMEAAAQICGSLAETTYDDSDGFEAATGCEASIMAVVRDQRREQARSPNLPAPSAGVLSSFVAGPVWREEEEEDECWTAEIQVVGGHAVVATVHAGSKAEVENRRDAIIAALSNPAGEGGVRLDDDGYLWKWVERGLFDGQVSAKEALEVIAYHPAAPWKSSRWDVDHKSYAKAFYAKFPKALSANGGEAG